MPFQLRCACGKRLQVQDEWVGKKIRCSHCNEVLTASPPDDATDMAVTTAPLKKTPTYDEYEDDERPRFKKRGDEDDEDEDDDRRQARRRRFDDDNDGLKSVAHMTGANSPNANIGYGILMMVGAVVLFSLGLAFDSIIIYSPFLFIAGIVAVVRGALKRP